MEQGTKGIIKGGWWQEQDGWWGRNLTGTTAAFLGQNIQPKAPVPRQYSLYYPLVCGTKYRTEARCAQEREYPISNKYFVKIPTAALLPGDTHLPNPFSSPKILLKDWSQTSSACCNIPPAFPLGSVCYLSLSGCPSSLSTLVAAVCRFHGQHSQLQQKQHPSQPKEIWPVLPVQRLASIKSTMSHSSKEYDWSVWAGPRMKDAWLLFGGRTYMAAISKAATQKHHKTLALWREFQKAWPHREDSCHSHTESEHMNEDNKMSARQVLRSEADSTLPPESDHLGITCFTLETP